MKKILSTILASMFLLQFTAITVMAEEEVVIHVSTTGTSEGTGTAEDPVDSLNRAAELAKTYSGQAVKIAVHEGKYNIEETLSLQNVNSGSEGAPITYTAYGDGDVIFTGATELSGSDFEKVTDANVLKRMPRNARTEVLQFDLSAAGIDYTDSDEIVPYLYVNNSLKTMSRYPNEGFLKATAATGTLSFTYSDIDISKWETAKDMYICGSTGATYFWYTFPASVEGSTITANRKVRKNTEFFVENLIEELDVPGEYAIDRENDILYYYPAEDLKTSKIEITSFLKNAVEMTNTNNVIFDGLTFEKIGGKAFNIVNAENVYIKNCNINYIQGSQAIYFKGNESKITDNTFYGCAGNVITFHGGSVKTLTYGNVEVVNNRISYCGFRDRMSIIDSGSSATSAPSDFGNKINNNLIQDCMTFMSIVCNANDYEIKNNEIVNQGYWIGDGGAIYMGRSNVKYGTEVAYNYIHEGHRGDPAYAYCGIYSDDGYGGTNFHHNVVKDMYQGMIANLGANGKLNNNLFINNSHPFGMGAVMTNYTVSGGAVENGHQDMMYNEANTILNKTTYGAAFGEYYPLIKEGLSRKPYFAAWDTEVTGNVTILGDYSTTTKAFGSRPWHPYYEKDGTTVVIPGEEVLVAANPDALMYGSRYIGSNLYTGYYVDTLMLYGAKITDDEGNDLNGTNTGNPTFNWDDAYFKDPENQDYSLTDVFSCDVSTVEEIDMSNVGIVSSTNPELYTENPESITLLSPANGEENVYEEVDFTWERVKNASKYRLIVANDAGMTDVVVDETFNDGADAMIKTESLEMGKTYYWQITAYAIAKNDSFEVSSDVYSFTTRTADIWNREGSEYAKGLLDEQIKAYEDGLIIYTDDTIQTTLENLSENSKNIIENATTQAELDSVEDSIIEELANSAQYINDINPEITECRVDQDSDDVYVTGTGFGKSKKVSVIVTNPDYNIENSHFDLTTVQYTDIIKSDKNGIISFKFNTRVENEDRSGVYTLYIKSENGEIIEKKYSYGIISAGDVICKDANGAEIVDITNYHGEEITMNCEIDNGTDAAITPCIITAFYNNGTLNQVSSDSSNSVEAMSKATAEWTVNVSDSDFTKAQVMFMDSLVTLKPLTKVRVIYELTE